MAQSVHDAHARPPDGLRGLFKQWQKSCLENPETGPALVDTNLSTTDDRLRNHHISKSDSERIREGYERFMNGQIAREISPPGQYFEVKSLPGLFVYPRLFSVELQTMLLDRLLHRDLSNPNHKTNLHLHYHMPDSDIGHESFLEHTSFYQLDRASTILPRDVIIHKPITLSQVLEKKLRWVTLGGQYDWTRKVYPDDTPPEFPQDIAELLRSIFPSVDPQAAILNFYSPGDTLSLHRDVSEDCDRGLISLSIGCDALFLVANTDGSEKVTIQLRSGDVVLMSGESRYAWHAVPKVVSGTCPELLRSWPAMASESAYDQWQGWLANKRINLNVRQMKDQPDARTVTTTKHDVSSSVLKPTGGDALPSNRSVSLHV